ncbi:LacI family DNA-binding transcriptional regulator [Cohnella zeiphila]|uniref:LacI family DNA-binding transcriptional regulator n=1 Tax=Cohnella zeiphila TaxID=2761120 RepID=A0A7X0VYM7_9BACL|nr:LacI family DNA-binding transcriptional regulator [Cohnella zeiphila]MBB6733118.1 LacI family DNA-binding transcriptional regulator [Cohnella zeiphila]
MKVSIFDVARRAGLSVVTVSRVLNGAASVRDKNREKVLQAMKELDYRPNASARSLAKGKTGIIGLTLRTLQDSFFDAVAKEINDRLAERGYYLALSVSPEGEGSPAHSTFKEDRVDGVLLLSPIREDESVLELKRRKIPVVLLDNQMRHSPAPSVIVDNFKGGFDAACHLIGLGHRRISHIAGPGPFLSSRERERGFRAAMAEAGLQPFSVERGTFRISSGYEIAERWIRADRLPTAVFAADDNIALGVMDACKNAGLRLPRDLSVVGFDDQPYAAEFRPGLTTVRQPAGQIARHGVELLLKRIEGAPQRSVTVKLEPELVVRESAAPIA